MRFRLAYRRSLPRTLGGAALLLLSGGFVVRARKEPGSVEVVDVSLVLPRLDRRLDGYRIALIGDLHVDGRMSPGRVLGLVELVNAEAPDLVAITGDFATHSRLRSLIRHVPGLVAPLRRLDPPDGVFAVLGNHDHKTNAQVVRRTLAAAGVVELHNAVRTVERDGAVLHLCGIDSALEGVPDLDRVLGDLPESGAAVLLAHEPDVANEVAARGRFDLQLSGHSHAGQARLPLLGPSPLLPRLSRKYPDGLYYVDGLRLYTNRGLGSHPHLRFNCRPEITVITLRAQN